MFNAIAKPFGLLMMWLYESFQNYGLAVIVFALIVKLILLPFQMRAKRSTMRMTRLQPRIKELEKKHAANKRTFNEEVQKLYREENVKPMAGCLWNLIPFPILIALYQAIRFPLTIMMGVPSELLTKATDSAPAGAIQAMLDKLGFSTNMNAAYEQIAQTQFISRAENWPFFANLSEKLRQIDYSFLGLDLGMKPQLKVLWQGNWSDPDTKKLLLLLIIPILAAVLTLLQSKVSMKLTNTGDSNDPQQRSAQSMMYMMPLMTLYFAFIMPAALGVYWIAGSVFAIIQEILLNKRYQKIFEKEDAEYNERQRQKAEELEAKRKETERLKAENATTRNQNTSKKKIQITEREVQREKAREWEKKKNASSDDEDDPTRVGQRRYARGRAYDPNRYADNGVTAPAPVAEELTEAVEETAEGIAEKASGAEKTAVSAAQEAAGDIEETAEELEDDVEEELDDWSDLPEDDDPEEEESDD